MDSKNLQIIRESFGRIVYTHKTHEKDAERQRQFSTWVKWINIVLTAFTSSALLDTLITDSEVAKIIAAIFAFLSLMFTIFQLSFNPAMSAEKHQLIAKQLWKFREDYIAFIADIMNEILSREEIVEKRNNLTEDVYKVYQSAPATSKWAYKKAKEALKIEEEFEFSNEEINQFLPEELHITDIPRKNND